MLRQFASDYLAGADPKTPLASPLFASLSGLPPLLLQVCAADLLFSDSDAWPEQQPKPGSTSSWRSARTYPNLYQINSASSARLPGETVGIPSALGSREAPSAGSPVLGRPCAARCPRIVPAGARHHARLDLPDLAIDTSPRSPTGFRRASEGA